MRNFPLVCNIEELSGLHTALKHGMSDCTIVDRSRPLRDQIFTNPSSPAGKINDSHILLNNSVNM